MTCLPQIFGAMAMATEISSFFAVWIGSRRDMATRQCCWSTHMFVPCLWGPTEKCQNPKFTQHVIEVWNPPATKTKKHHQKPLCAPVLVILPCVFEIVRPFITGVEPGCIWPFRAGFDKVSSCGPCGVLRTRPVRCIALPLAGGEIQTTLGGWTLGWFFGDVGCFKRSTFSFGPKS